MTINQEFEQAIREMEVAMLHKKFIALIARAMFIYYLAVLKQKNHRAAVTL